jgi:hypothetical protein
MKTGPILLVGCGLLALLYFGNLGIAGNVLQYYIQSVNFTGITSGTITLVIQNPSNATIILNSMAGTVAVNGTTLGNISNFQGGITIPANQQVPVTLTVAVSLFNTLGSLYAALTNPSGAQPLSFVVAGNANINAGTIIPFNITQTLNV